MTESQAEQLIELTGEVLSTLTVIYGCIAFAFGWVLMAALKRAFPRQTLGGGTEG